MKNSRLHREHGERDLPGYLHERPELLLKMLDVAEACWEENMMRVPSCNEENHRECA